MDRETVLDASIWLEIASFCDRFNMLPRDGGIMHQFPREMKRVGIMLQALDSYEKEMTDKEMAKRDKS